jgi:hypothetical protein
MTQSESEQADAAGCVDLGEPASSCRNARTHVRRSAAGLSICPRVDPAVITSRLARLRQVRLTETPGPYKTYDLMSCFRLNIPFLL